MNLITAGLLGFMVGVVLTALATPEPKCRKACCLCPSMRVTDGQSVAKGEPVYFVGMTQDADAARGQIGVLLDSAKSSKKKKPARRDARPRRKK